MTILVEYFCKEMWRALCSGATDADSARRHPPPLRHSAPELDAATLPLTPSDAVRLPACRRGASSRSWTSTLTASSPSTRSGGASSDGSAPVRHRHLSRIPSASTRSRYHRPPPLPCPRRRVAHRRAADALARRRRRLGLGQPARAGGAHPHDGGAAHAQVGAAAQPHQAHAPAHVRQPPPPRQALRAVRAVARLQERWRRRPCGFWGRRLRADSCGFAGGAAAQESPWHRLIRSVSSRACHGARTHSVDLAAIAHSPSLAPLAISRFDSPRLSHIYLGGNPELLARRPRFIGFAPRHATRLPMSTQEARRLGIRIRDLVP